MKNIDSELRRRALSKMLTKANNANPSMEVVVTRPRTPIFNKKFWQESIITSSVDVTCTTVAIRKTKKNSDKAYAAYIAGGTLTVKSSMLTFPVKNMAWTVETTVNGCIGCALEFDGSFVRQKRNVEYQTELTPWLFYTTTTGELWAGKLGESFELLAASGTSTIDVVRGISSQFKDIDQGMIVFYIQNNAVYYRQLIDGEWQGQQQVTIAPTNPISIKVERLFDYRICLQIADLSGALWEVFTKMEASGWNGTEYISLGLSQRTKVLPVKYCDFYTNENIMLSLTQETTVLYALSPVIINAENIDDGNENYGLKVRLEWDERIYGETENAGAFILSDNYGGTWSGQTVIKTGKVLTITFVNFNNAINPVTLTYTPGTMMGDVVAVNADSILFDAAGLIPEELPRPEALSADNVDAKQIIISFDMTVDSTNWENAKNGFTVTCQEYDMIPGGMLAAKTYEIASAERLDTDATKVLINLTDVGRMKCPIGDVTISYDKSTGNLAGELGGQVNNFAQGFTPDNITPLFNPDDIENIDLSLSQSTVVRQINYTNYQSDTEHLSVSLSQTTVVINVNYIEQ